MAPVPAAWRANVPPTQGEEDVVQDEFTVYGSGPVAHELNGQIMPDHIVQERRVSAARTRLWWKRAHQSNDQWHQKFPGYCLICQQEVQ